MIKYLELESSLLVKLHNNQRKCTDYALIPQKQVIIT